MCLVQSLQHAVRWPMNFEETDRKWLQLQHQHRERGGGGGLKEVAERSCARCQSERVGWNREIRTRSCWEDVQIRGDHIASMQGGWRTLKLWDDLHFVLARWNGLVRPNLALTTWGKGELHHLESIIVPSVWKPSQGPIVCWIKWT
jgi:hypothetical protein